MTASVISGRAVSGEIVCGPAPGMAKRILSGPGAVLASSIALRREPSPLFAVLVTTNSAPLAERGTPKYGMIDTIARHVASALAIGKLIRRVLVASSLME